MNENKVTEAIQQASKEAAKHTHVSDKVKSLQQGMPQERTDTDKQNKSAEEKDLAYWKANAEEDYMKVPISVLRYITQMEQELTILQQANNELLKSEKIWSEKANHHYEESLKLQQANAELQKEVDKWRDSANYYKDTYPVVIAELEKQNAELSEILKIFYEDIKKRPLLSVEGDQLKERTEIALKLHESNKQP